MAFNLGDIFVSIKARTDDLERGLQNIGVLGNEAGGRMGGLNKALAATVQGSQMLAAGLAVAGAAVVGLATAGVRSAGEFEQSRIAFETMLGSADKARKMMQDISEFAKNTPFELPQVVAASKQLLAFGIAQEDIIPTMRRLGDVAAGVGVPVGQLAYVYGQVRVAGKLMGGDLMQFTNAGIPMIEGLSEVLKVSKADVKQMVEEGKVGFSEVEQVINNLTDSGSKFGGMMDKQSHSLNGVISNIKDGFGQALRSMVGITAAGDIIQGGLFDKIKVGAEKLMPIVQRLPELMHEGFEKVKPYIPQIAGAILVALVPAFLALAGAIWTAVAPILPLLAAGALLGLAIKTLVDNLGGWSAAWDRLKAAMEPIVNVIIGFLWPALQTLWSSIAERLWPALQNLWDLIVRLTPLWEVLAAILGGVVLVAIRVIIDALNLVITVISWLINALVAVVNAAITSFNAIVGAVQWMGNMIASVFNFIAGVASGVWNGIASGFKWAWQQVVGVWSAAAGFFAGIWGSISGAVGGVAGAISGAFASAFNGVKSIVTSAINWVVDKVNGVIRSVNNSAGKLPGVPNIPQIPRLFKGVQGFVGGLAMIHDQGEEIVQLPNGSNVFTANQSRQLLAGAGAGSRGIQVYIDNSNANITSPHVADQYGEKIGDAIIRRLQQNVRL